MRRRPIENDADAILMAAVDEVHEIGGRAEAAGGGVVAEGLVAPGAVEGGLHDGEQFDVGVAKVSDVGGELFGEVAVGEPAIGVFPKATPRGRMAFVNWDWRFG